MLINKNLKKFIIYVIRNLPINIFYYFFLKNKIKVSSKNNKKIKILILNEERFTQDIEILKHNNNFELIIFNSKLQLFINNLWMHNTRDIFKQWRKKNQFVPFNKLYFSNENKIVIQSKNNLYKYLQSLILKLKKEINFDFIMTCAVWYVQDKEWERACEVLKIPFIAIHKECMFDKDVINREINLKRSMNCQTYNSKVILYNEKAKQVLTESGITKSNNSYVFGSLRMDYLNKLIKKNTQKDSKIITIFSFTHRNGLVDFTKQNTNTNFSTYPKEGFHDLFNNFHGSIAELAIKYSNLKFIIKVKWDYKWIEKIEEAIFLRTNKYSKNINNLSIISKANTHDLIFKSGLIMSFNSSTVVESVALKKPVVIPLFNEADQFKGKLFKDHVYFKDYFDQFFIALSEEDLEKYILKFINKKLPKKKINNKFIEYYIGKVDGYCVDRLSKFMISLKRSLN